MQQLYSMVPVGKTKAVNYMFLLVENCVSVIFKGIGPILFSLYSAWLMTFTNKKQTNKHVRSQKEHRFQLDCIDTEKRSTCLSCVLED